MNKQQIDLLVAPYLTDIKQEINDQFECLECGFDMCEVEVTDWHYYWKIDCMLTCKACGASHEYETQVFPTQQQQNLCQGQKISKINVKAVRVILSNFDTLYKNSFKNILYA